MLTLIVGPFAPAVAGEPPPSTPSPPSTPVPAAPSDAPVANAPAEAPTQAFAPLTDWVPPSDYVEDEVTVRRRRVRRAWPNIVLGMGIGGLGAGTGMGLAARHSEARARSAYYQADEFAAIEAGRGRALAANWLWVVGAVLTAAGGSVTLYRILHPDEV